MHVTDADKPEEQEESDEYIPKSMEYLNESCPRERIYFLIYILNEKCDLPEDAPENHKLTNKLVGLAEKYQLDRLQRIVTDVERIYLQETSL